MLLHGQDMYRCQFSGFNTQCAAQLVLFGVDPTGKAVRHHAKALGQCSKCGRHASLSSDEPVVNAWCPAMAMTSVRVIPVW